MRKVYSHDKERGTTQQNLRNTERETVKNRHTTTLKATRGKRSSHSTHDTKRGIDDIKRGTRQLSNLPSDAR